MTKRALWLIVLIFSLARAAYAEDAYPARPVKLVAPFPAAGPLDVIARLVAAKLTEAWKNPVVVENVTGASGSIGANAVARAAPDGYTLLITVDIPLAMYPAVAKSLPYEPDKDFKAIAGVDMTHVPYKGAAPAALSGEVSLMFGPIAQGAPHVRSGKLRALGVTGTNPSPLLPGVKPLVQQGFAGLLVRGSQPTASAGAISRSARESSRRADG
jgi:tripartite-type tricarboxylate transporter receptor subunit TctC